MIPINEENSVPAARVTKGARFLASASLLYWLLPCLILLGAAGTLVPRLDDIYHSGPFTSLLGLLGGRNIAWSGSVRVDGQEVGDLNGTKLYALRRRMGESEDV